MTTRKALLLAGVAGAALALAAVAPAAAAELCTDAAGDRIYGCDSVRAIDRPERSLDAAPRDRADPPGDDDDDDGGSGDDDDDDDDDGSCERD
jgi:hypothetical protein